MRQRFRSLAAASAVCATTILWSVVATEAFGQTLALDPDAPRYFTWRGAPTVLVGSGEHYGAVLNPDFDFIRYLDTLQADGLNLTRIFTGSYLERAGDFGIARNTLAPAPGRALTPWARSAEPGFALGGNRFDLTRWDEAYFTRLRDFVRAARNRGVVVEVVLFSAYYGRAYSPLFAQNNVNGVGNVTPHAMNTFANDGALAFQEAMTRRIVRELADADNVYFEIQNEPWEPNDAFVRTVTAYYGPDDLRTEGLIWKNRVYLATDASLAWQRRVAGWIADEERQLGVRHLIAQNYANFVHAVDDVDPNVSVINFHYALPDAARANLGLGRAVASDETGAAGRADEPYRKQAWHFMLAGGSAFNHLDHSFAVGAEDGSASADASGAGTPALRRQLAFLRRMLLQTDLRRLRPDDSYILHAGRALTRGVSDGRVRLVYFDGQGPSTVKLHLPEGSWRVEWFSPVTTEALGSPVTIDGAREGTLTSPAFTEDLLLRLTPAR